MIEPDHRRANFFLQIVCRASYNYRGYGRRMSRPKRQCPIFLH